MAAGYDISQIWLQTRGNLYRYRNYGLNVELATGGARCANRTKRLGMEMQRLRRRAGLVTSLTVGFAMVSSAEAQSPVNPHVLSSMIANMNRGPTVSCLSLDRQLKPTEVERFDREAEPGLRTYLELAAKNADPSPAFKRRLPGPWALDDVPTRDIRSISDPWASKVVRLEKVGVMLGRAGVFGHGVWRAFDANDQLLGTYDADLIRKAKGFAVMRLRLWSVGQESKIRSLAPYCVEPGDHETWREAEAERAAKKAKRRAEAAARRQ